MRQCVVLWVMEFLNITGKFQQRNEVLAFRSDENLKNIFFFPGDIQRREQDVTKAQKDAYGDVVYDYCLEKCMEIFKSKFKKSNVFLVLPGE